MKTLNTLTTLAAATALFAGQAIASPEFDNHANYGSVLSGHTASSGGAYQPTGHLVGVASSSANYGSVLFDLDRSSPRSVATAPGIGDSADDFGSILYDTGSVY